MEQNSFGTMLSLKWVICCTLWGGIGLVGIEKWLRLKGEMVVHFPKDVSIHTPFSITEKKTSWILCMEMSGKVRVGVWEKLRNELVWRVFW